MNSRMVLWGALGICLMAFFAWIDAHIAKSALPAGSIYRQGERGYALTADYLRERGYTIRPLSERLFGVRTPASATVIRFANNEGNAVDAPTMSNADRGWVEQGGHLIVAVGNTSCDAELPISTQATSPLLQAIHHVCSPSGLTQLIPPSAAYLLGEKQSPIVGVNYVGKGHITYVATMQWFDDDHLALNDHALLLEILLQSPLQSSQRTVIYADEWSIRHQEYGVSEVFGELRLTPIALLAFFIAALYAWRQRATLGPPDDEPTEIREAAVDGLAAMSHLLATHVPPDTLMTSAEQRFIADVAHRRGITLQACEKIIAPHLGDAAQRSALPIAQRLTRLQTAQDLYS